MSYIYPDDPRTQEFQSQEFGNAWAVHRGAVFKTHDLTPFLREWHEWLEAYSASIKSSPQPEIKKYLAYGESNQSDGYGPRYLIGEYASFDEAREAVKGKGVQGELGSISLLMTPEHGAPYERPLFTHRRTPEGSYSVGFLDLREFEYGFRKVSAGEPQPAKTGMFNYEKFPISEQVEKFITQISPLALRELLLNSSDFVGVWRVKGDVRWRGEFVGSTSKELDKWLPPTWALDVKCDR